MGGGEVGLRTRGCYRVASVTIQSMWILALI